MVDTLRDVRQAVRQLRRSGTFTFAVVLTLGLGIGLNAAIFTMVDGVLLRPLGYRDANRIYGLNTRFVDEARSIPRVGGGDFIDLAQQVSGLESAAYYSPYQDAVQTAGHTLFTDISESSPKFGQVMGVEPVAGRLFVEDSGAVTQPVEAMVSSEFARDNFGSSAAAVGQSMKFEGSSRTIVGVLPAGFSFPGKTQVWIEAPSLPVYTSRTAYNQRAIGKVKPGVSMDQLNAEMSTLSRQLEMAYPEDKHKALEAVPLQEQIVGRISPVLRLLMAAVGVVLLIVCANITHLQLVRATQLRREVTIRTALGATRTVLVWRAALEVLLLSGTGCLTGVLVALPALRILVRLAPREIPRLADVQLNSDVIAFSFAVSLVTMAVTALLPLWRSWRIDPSSAMKQDVARGVESRGSGRLRQALIAGEVALTLTLSVAATLLVRQMISDSRQELGFAPQKLVVVDTHASGAAAAMMANYKGTDPPAGEALAAYRRAQATDLQALDSLLDGIRAVPGVSAADAIYGAPMSDSGSNVGYAVRGVSTFGSGGSRLPVANIAAVTPGYFGTMGIPLLRGRQVTNADGPSGEKVVLISEAMVRQSFAGQDPVGKQIMCGWDSTGEWWTIVGVVGDVRQDSPGTQPKPTIYAPIAQHAHAAPEMQLVVRTRTDEAAMASTLTETLKRQFPQVASKATTMQEAVGETERTENFRTLLFGSFAGVSILLAATGMFGVTAYTVAQKRFEFALLFALGAQRSQVLKAVLGRALQVSVAGVVCGIALSFATMRGVSTLLGQMPAFDLVSYTVAALGVLGITLAASLQPAWRASTVEPMKVLRDQ